MIAFDLPEAARILGLGAAGLLGAAALFGLGYRVGRRQVRHPGVDQYALDYGRIGLKRARAIRRVAKRDWLFEIFETNYLDYGKWPARHIMRVPVEMSFLGYNTSLLLSPVESAKVEAGDWAYFEALARQVQDNPQRFRCVHVDTSGLDARESSQAQR